MPGIKIPIGRGIRPRYVKSWSSYWKNRTDVFLFFGQIANITGGRLYNEMNGSSDYITVGGTAGSYTFQCPNAAAYIAADTDWFWFTSIGILNTVTESNLLKYDFSRTIVYYDDTSPYALRAIAILKPTASVTNKMRDDFHLSVWWDDTLSDHGYVKGNRSTGRSVWNKYTKLLSHFEGDNNSTTSVDDILGAWSFVGSAVISTMQKKFGVSSLYCPDGKNNVVMNASENVNFYSGDFTIDFWFRPSIFNDNGSSFLCGQSDVTASASSRQSNIAIKAIDKKLIFYFWDSASTLLTSSLGSTVFAVNNWYHVAVVRNGNTITGYVNGVPECTLDVTGKTLQSATGKFSIGGLGEYNTTVLSAKGYIDEFRISKGIARWTSDFSSSLPVAANIID